MEQKYSVSHLITPGECDFSGKLGVYDTFRVFQDIAGIHCSEIGLSQPDVIKCGFFWLVVKTKIHFNRRPGMAENVSISTWPLNVRSFASDRCYTITSDKEILVEGKTEWAFLNTQTMKPEKMSNVLTDEFKVIAEDVSFGSIPRFFISDNAETIGEYTVNSMDTDVGNHMNNTCYVRAFLSMFSIHELINYDIKDITILYKKPAHEGDVLRLVKDRTGIYSFVLPDGNNAVILSCQ